MSQDPCQANLPGYITVTRVKELADAVSTQAQVSNRTWFAMMTVALLTLLPRGEQQSPGLRNLPVLGEVAAPWFYIIAYLMLVVLIIAFASAQAQQVVAQRLAQKVIDGLEPECGSVDPRTLFDMLRKPSLNRIAPLAQSLRGICLPRFKTERSRKWLQTITTSYYDVLKFVALFVYFVLPCLALWYAFLKITSLPAPVTAVLACFGLLASISLVQIITLEYSYAKEARRHL